MTALYNPTTGDEPDAADLATLVPRLAFKNADQSYSSTTLANDLSLVVASIPAIGVWEVYLRAILSAAAGAPAMDVDFTLPAGADLSSCHFELTGPSGPSLTNANGGVTAIPVSTSTAAGTKLFIVRGLLTMSGSSGGNLQWRAAAHSSGTVTVKAGSYMILRQVV